MQVARKQFQRKMHKLGKELVFIDETSFSLNLRSKYGWALIGEAPHAYAPLNKQKRISVLSAFGRTGIICSLFVEGSVKKKHVDQLLKQLKRRYTCAFKILWDNHTIHQESSVQAVFQRRKSLLVFLPPYSPDLNPIEQAWGWVKQKIARENITDQDQLIAIIKKTLKKVTPQLAKAWIKHIGYQT